MAETTRALRALETHHAPSYCLPPEDIRAKLPSTSGSTVCEWKGEARNFDVIAGATTAPHAAWAYDRPTARFAPLACYVAFYAGLMYGAWVGVLRVLPQPGDFYGGWITAQSRRADQGSARYAALVKQRAPCSSETTRVRTD